MLQSKLDVRIPAEGGIELGAWLFLPEGDGPHPAITMAHGFAGPRNTALSVSLGHSPRPAWSCFCTTIAISARAAGTSAETSTRGGKSQTGVERSPILRRARKLIRRPGYHAFSMNHSPMPHNFRPVPSPVAFRLITIAKFHAEAVSDNPVYLAQRERLVEALRLAGAPER